MENVIIAEKDDLLTFENNIIRWPSNVLDDVSVVSNDFVFGNKYKNSIFENGTVIGRTNVELTCEMATKLAESFGSVLPVGSTVYVSRDYHKSSRMLKRAFLGGLLSTGINVFDLKLTSPTVMCFCLANNDHIVAGVHFEQSFECHSSTQITFFTDEGLNIDISKEKAIERIFSRENFLRVNYIDIGEIYENGYHVNSYVKNFLESLDVLDIKHKKFRLAIDLQYGTAASIFPAILNELDVDSVILNAYFNDKKLPKLTNQLIKSKRELSEIIIGMKLDLGLLIYPDFKTFDIICNNGIILERYIALLVFLELLNRDGHKKRVLLPVWAPDFIDHRFQNLRIDRSKINNLKGAELRQYDFIATTTGNYVFSEFSFHFDSLFASMKLIEMLSRESRSISEIAMSFEPFYYFETKIACENRLKGKMMRKLLEDSLDKKNTNGDGIKIWMNEKDWIVIIPDQNSDALRLYIQASTAKEGQKILKEYTKKIRHWTDE
ncbi:MAG: hypothetical protein NT103_07585 [Campylobacterales bacterium]|nr:hypothetical protein [Campylobacterales bacterium]